MLASMICDQEEALGELKENFEKAKKEIEGEQKGESSEKEEGRKIREENIGKAKEGISNEEEIKETQTNLESVKQEGSSSLCITSSASEIKSSNSPGLTSRPAFAFPTPALSSTGLTSFKPSSTGLTVNGCPSLKSAPRAEEGVTRQSCSVSPNIISDLALRRGSIMH